MVARSDLGHTSMAEELKQNESAEQAQGETTSTPAAPATPAPSNPNFKWYIIHSYSGFERKVTTPSAKEVRATTGVVIVTVFLFAAYFYVVDGVMGKVIDTLLKWAKG